MAVSADQIAQVRRMTAEPTTTTYSDASITAYINARRVPDPRGLLWYTWDYSTEPPTQDDNADWIPTYDLNGAAADIWDEKAAAVACDYDTNADGAGLSRSQVRAAYAAMASKYRSRSVPGCMKFAKIDRVLTDEGEVVEDVPIIDRYEQDDHN